MSLFWDAMRYGVPVVAALGGAQFAQSREKGTGALILGAGIGWIAGWSLQWGLSKIIDGPGERLPTQTTQPSIASGSVQIPSAEDVLNREGNIGMIDVQEEGELEEDELPPTPPPTPMGTSGPPKRPENDDLKPTTFTGFNPKNFGSDSSN